MKILTWNAGMSDKDMVSLAYWERNVLALRYADGWYNDDAPCEWDGQAREVAAKYHFLLAETHPRYQGWRRCLTLDGGRITFHVPDDFEVGNLPQVMPNWDGHTTEEKWKRILETRGIQT